MSPNNNNQHNGVHHHVVQQEEAAGQDAAEQLRAVKKKEQEDAVDDTDDTTEEEEVVEGDDEDVTSEDEELQRKVQTFLEENVVGADPDKPKLQSWQENYLYLAPSKHGTGWGVYAAKPFNKGDIVEVAPLFLRFAEEEPVLKETILDHYHYEYWKWNGYGHDAHTVLSFGFSLLYNHGEKPNIKYDKWGEEPTIDDPSSSVAVGYYAKRNIKVGEELLCTYGGQSWFEQRGMIMVDPTSKDGKPIEGKKKKEKHDATTTAANLPLTLDDDDSSCSDDDEDDIHPHHSSRQPSEPAIPLDDEEWKELYTSKIYTGHGKKKLKQVMKSITQAKSERKYNMKPYYKTRAAPFNAGYRNARAKVNIKAEGITLEIVPALIISKKAVKKTLLEPIVLQWKDIEPCSLDPSIHSIDTLKVLYKRDSTCWLPQYEDKGIEHTCIIPLAGSLALIERTTSDNPDDYNCRLEGIVADEHNENAFTLRIVSTKPIQVGEQLVLKMANISASKKRHNFIWMELLETGQPTPTTTETKQTDSGNLIVLKEEEKVLDIDVDEIVNNK